MDQYNQVLLLRNNWHGGLDKVQCPVVLSVDLKGLAAAMLKGNQLGQERDCSRFARCLRWSEHTGGRNNNLQPQDILMICNDMQTHKTYRHNNTKAEIQSHSPLTKKARVTRGFLLV